MSSKLPTLDLHGYKVEDVFDAVDAFLQKHSGKKQVRIMPGKGSGKVRSRVIEYLKLANYPWSFERLPNGASNEGVIVVHME